MSSGFNAVFRRCFQGIFPCTCHPAGRKGLVLVLQYCPGGNLSALLQREGHLPEALSKLYTAEAREDFFLG